MRRAVRRRQSAESGGEQGELEGVCVLSLSERRASTTNNGGLTRMQKDSNHAWFQSSPHDFIGNARRAGGARDSTDEIPRAKFPARREPASPHRGCSGVDPGGQGAGNRTRPWPAHGVAFGKGGRSAGHREGCAAGGGVPGTIHERQERRSPNRRVGGISQLSRRAGSETGAPIVAGRRAGVSAP